MICSFYKHYLVSAFLLRQMLLITIFEFSTSLNSQSIPLKRNISPVTKATSMGVALLQL